MSESGFIVVDWTGSVLEIGVFDQSVRGHELRSSFTLPTRTVLRQKSHGEIECLFGADAVAADDQHTIQFRHPGRDLPKIEDNDLQIELLKAFWQGLHDLLIREEALSAGQVAPVYLIPPPLFTQPILDQLHKCAGQTPLRLYGTIAPATALVMGALGQEIVVDDLIRVAGEEEITAGCFVLREEFIEGIFFSYKTTGPHQHSIAIQDYFQVTSDKLAHRLSEFDCSDLDVLLVVEDPRCSDSIKGKSIAFLQEVSRRAQWIRFSWSSEVSLKLKGCAEVAKFATGDSTDPGDYEISHAYNLGIQINQSQFYPLITRAQLKSGKFPAACSQSFRLSRRPTNGLALNFCGGYSTSLAESVSLGRVVLSESELRAITDDTFLAVSIRMDTPGSGEFFLRLMPENQILRQQSYRVPGLAMVLVFFVLFSFVFLGRVAAQTQPSSSASKSTGEDASEYLEDSSKVIRIYLDQPLTRELRRFTSGVREPGQTKIEFNGGKGRPWSFVKFDPLPEHTSVAVSDQPPGYQASEELKSDIWYPFKTMLPVVFNIDAQAKAPVQLKFRVGYPEDEEIIAKQKISEVRKLDPESVKEFTNVQVLAFYWGPSVINIESTSLAFARNEITKQITLKGDSRRWTIVRLPTLPDGIQATVNSTSPDDLSKPQGQLKAGEWVGFRNSAILEFQLDRSKVKVNPGSITVDLETAIDLQPGQTKEAVNAGITAGKIISNGNIQLGVSWDQPERNLWLILGIVVGGAIVLGVIGFVVWDQVAKKRPKDRPARDGIKSFRFRGKKKRRGHHGDYDYGDGRGATAGTNSNQAPVTPPPASSIVTQPPSPLGDGHPAIQQEDLDRVKRELENRIAISKDDYAQQLREASATYAKSEVLAERLSTLKSDLTGTFNGRLDEALKSVKDSVSRLEQDKGAWKPEVDNLQTRLKDFSLENVDRIKEVEMRLRGELDQLQKMVVEQAFPESYFARTMGMVLSKNILELHEGNLERLIGEAVNSFFQTDVPGADSLQGLRQRAESIIATLNNVLEIISSKKPEVEPEIRLRFGRAAALLAKISDVQNQLQSRKLTLETSLRIPVSAYAGARQTLIEELGRGIRSELDKLADVQNYFEGDLERLVTADLIAIVDICDKKVSSPVGSDSEVETVLQQLFLQAGLRPILPSSGEAFGTAEQDLVQMVAGTPGTSMTVAEVVTRGFYYTHRDNETLLRKAGVTVYR